MKMKMKTKMKMRKKDFEFLVEKNYWWNQGTFIEYKSGKLLIYPVYSWDCYGPTSLGKPEEIKIEEIEIED